MKNDKKNSNKQLLLTSMLLGALSINSFMQISSRELSENKIQIMEWSSNEPAAGSTPAAAATPTATSTQTEATLSIEQFMKDCPDLDCASKISKLSPADKAHIESFIRINDAIKANKDKKEEPELTPAQLLAEEQTEFLETECKDKKGSALSKCRIDAKVKFKEKKAKELAEEKIKQEKKKLALRESDFKEVLSKIKEECKVEDKTDKEEIIEKKKCRIEKFAEAVKSASGKQPALTQKFINAQFNVFAKNDLAALIFNSNVSPEIAESALTNLLDTLPEEYSHGKNGLNLVVLSAVKAKATQQAKLASQSYEKAWNARNTNQFSQLFETANRDRREFNAMDLMTRTTLESSPAMQDNDFSLIYKHKFLPDIQNMYNTINPKGLVSNGSTNAQNNSQNDNSQSQRGTRGVGNLQTQAEDTIRNNMALAEQGIRGARSASTSTATAENTTTSNGLTGVRWNTTQTSDANVTGKTTNSNGSINFGGATKTSTVSGRGSR